MDPVQHESRMGLMRDAVGCRRGNPRRCGLFHLAHLSGVDFSVQSVRFPPKANPRRNRELMEVVVQLYTDVRHDHGGDVRGGSAFESP